MKSPDKTKKILEEMSFQAGDGLHRDVKHDMVAAYEPVRKAAWITRMAIALVVCLGLVIALRLRIPPPVHTPELTSAPALSLAQRTTSWSLDRVFKAGGLEALDDHFFETNTLGGAWPNSVSIEDLLNNCDF